MLSYAKFACLRESTPLRRLQFVTANGMFLFIEEGQPMAKTIEEVMATLQSTVNRGEAAIAKLTRQIEEERAKINDANVTLRTLRSMGVSDVAPGVENALFAAATTFQAQSSMTVPDMVLHVMKVHRRGSYEPAEVMELIKMTLGVEPDPNNVRPTLWRMHKDGRLLKDQDGRYSLPQEIGCAGVRLPTDPAHPIENAPRAQGREAGPGGGT